MLKPILPQALTADHIALLIKADKGEAAFNSIDPTVLVKHIWNGSLQLFELNGGIILAEVNVGGDGSKRLTLVRLAGKNLALHFQEISKDLQHIARDLGCNAIESIVYSEKLARTLRRGGAKQESVTMVLELDNG